MDRLDDYFFGFVAGLILFAFSSLAAWKTGFYNYDGHAVSPKGRLSCFHLLFGFLIFLFTAVVVSPMLAATVIKLFSISFDFNNQILASWIGIFGIYLSIGSVLLYVSFFSKESRLAVWGGGDKRFKARCFTAGAFSWFFGYPTMYLVGQISGLFVLYLTDGAPIDQVAVQQLKQVQGQPFLYGIMIAAVCMGVPVIEEILFRGLLQTWLRQNLGWIPSVLIASAVFSLFHFSPAQGLSNIHLITSLFVFSCYLGYVYEKYQSLWAPIGLHITFNTMSVLMIHWMTPPSV